MSRHVTSMTIDDVSHYSEAERAQIVASYPAHEREARARGIPTMGSGRIFPIAESDLIVPAREVPKHWPQINGLDFGWDHPFAAVNIAWDRDADCVFVCKTYRRREETPVLHAASIKPWGEWIPCAWPHDGLQHDKGSGQQLREIYKSHGLNMLSERAEHAEGGNGVEAGLMEMLERMQTGRFKVFADLVEWLEEFRLYHRLNGKVVKERDDLMSATRYAVMMLREACVKPSSKPLAYGGKRYA
jgi:DNA invertase Pin-like site-specific DNA recombinase